MGADNLAARCLSQLVIPGERSERSDGTRRPGTHFGTRVYLAVGPGSARSGSFATAQEPDRLAGMTRRVGK